MILKGHFSKNYIKFIEKVLVRGVGLSPPGSTTEVVVA